MPGVLIVLLLQSVCIPISQPSGSCCCRAELLALLLYIRCWDLEGQGCLGAAPALVALRCGTQWRISSSSSPSDQTTTAGLASLVRAAMLDRMPVGGDGPILGPAVESTNVTWTKTAEAARRRATSMATPRRASVADGLPECQSDSGSSLEAASLAGSSPGTTRTSGKVSDGTSCAQTLPTARPVRSNGRGRDGR